MKKTMRKLIPAIAMLLISAAFAGTSTFAWFSMNNKVTVTGMEVMTHVGDNLLISATSDADPTDNTDYRASMVTTISQLLEPVSSINGLDGTFFYTSTTNVDGTTGDAVDEEYIAYNHASTGDFDTNYGTSGAKGYADYVFTLKAMNSSASTLYLDISELALRYGASETDGNAAFRVAVLAKAYDPEAGSPAYTDYASKTVLLPSADGSVADGDYLDEHATYNVKNTSNNGTETPADSGKYAWDLNGDSTTDVWGDAADPTAVTKWSSTNALDGDLNLYTTVSANANAVVASAPVAVNSTSTFAKVQNLGTAANIAEIAAGKTMYYEVTIRLWLEGEDEACTSDTFAKLTDKWQLDLTVLLQNQTAHENAATDPVSFIATTSGTRTLIAGDTISSNTKVIDGVTYKQLTTNSTLYTTESEAGLTKTSRIYTIADGVRPVDVTNQYRTYYIVTIVDNSDNITAVPETFEAYYGHMAITATGATTAPNATVTVTSGTATASITAADTITIASITTDATITLTNVAP